MVTIINAGVGPIHHAAFVSLPLPTGNQNSKMNFVEQFVASKYVLPTLSSYLAQYTSVNPHFITNVDIEALFKMIRVYQW